MNMLAHENTLSFHVDHLLTKARRLSRNEADARDLVQDTCVRALEALQRMVDAPLNMRGWLHVIMRHTWFNVVRNRRSQCAARAQLGSSDVDSRLVETRASYVQFARAWNELPENAQFIASQCLIDGDPYDVVSTRVGLSTAAIATSIHRTRKQLRGAMPGLCARVLVIRMTRWGGAFTIM